MTSPAATIAQAKQHFEAFGSAAARRLIAKVRQLPPGQDLAAMEAVMAKLSPTMFASAERYTQNAREAGYNPSDAMHVGVAKAMSEGLLTELHELGIKKVTGQELGADKGFVSSLRQQLKPTIPAAHISPDVTAASQYAALTGIQVGPFLFGDTTDSTMVQVKGNWPSPRWSTDDGHAAGLIDMIPMTPDGNNWQQIIAQIIAHDCDKTTLHNCMVDAGPTHRYGNISQFLYGFTPAQVNKDFIGLKSGDGQGGDDANKEPASPVIATVHPRTNEPWGVYMYLAVPKGGESWGTQDNPVALLFQFKKVEDTDCAASLITAQNVAVLAAATIATGGTYPLLVSLGILGGCYLWQYVKIVVAKILDVVEDVANAVKDVACDLAGTGVGAGITQAGVQSKNTPAMAVGAGLQVAQALCGTSCPPGAIKVGTTCACPEGSELAVVNGQQVCAPTPSIFSSPWGILGILFAAGLGFLLITQGSGHKAHAT